MDTEQIYIGTLPAGANQVMQVGADSKYIVKLIKLVNKTSNTVTVYVTVNGFYVMPQVEIPANGSFTSDYLEIFKPNDVIAAYCSSANAIDLTINGAKEGV